MVNMEAMYRYITNECTACVLTWLVEFNKIKVLSLAKALASSRHEPWKYSRLTRWGIQLQIDEQKTIFLIILHHLKVQMHKRIHVRTLFSWNKNYLIWVCRLKRNEMLQILTSEAKWPTSTFIYQDSLGHYAPFESKTALTQQLAWWSAK